MILIAIALSIGFYITILLKDSLNSDGQQFHQYQQNDQQPLLTEHNKVPRYMTLEIQVLALDMHKMWRC